MCRQRLDQTVVEDTKFSRVIDQNIAGGGGPVDAGLAYAEHGYVLRAVTGSRQAIFTLLYSRTVNSIHGYAYV